MSPRERRLRHAFRCWLAHVDENEGHTQEMRNGRELFCKAFWTIFNAQGTLQRHIHDATHADRVAKYMEKAAQDTLVVDSIRQYFENSPNKK
eukprot:6210022-Pleurochrysis_carterae.AAC.1